MGLGAYQTRGDYTGRLDEVQENIRRFGAIDVCSFVPGYFKNTLKNLTGPYAMVFLDVDLHESLRTCLLHLWPLLSDQGVLYTHEASQLDYVSLFFDREWWRTNLDTDSPGLIGAGCGVPTGVARGSGLGYTRKRSTTFALELEYQPFCGDPTQSVRQHRGYAETAATATHSSADN